MMHKQFNHKTGALAGGNDLEEGSYTLNEAMAHAVKLGPRCCGFTFASAQPTPDGELQCYFKSSQEGNSDPNWQTYTKKNQLNFVDD